jgi:4-amino-4-deoxy-L-arabinose transferase-like glycosyltransferase
MNLDEMSFATYGFTILKLKGNKDIVAYESKLPITALNGIPRAIEQIFHPGLKKNDWGLEDYYRGRYISLLATLLLGLLIFQWAKELYGRKIALLSFIFYLICPNFLAHGIFVGTDIYASLFLTASFYFLWKYHHENKMKYFLLFSLAVAFAQISKFSMVFLFLLIPVLLLLRFLFTVKTEQKRSPFLLLFFIFILINIFIISSSHLFYQMFMPLRDYTFISEPFKKLQHILGFLPAPLPSSYLRSMDAVIYFDSMGNDIPNSISNIAYILGVYNPHGIWYYYFVTLFFKLPIPALLIWITSLILFLKNYSKAWFIKTGVYLLLPFLFYLVYFDFFYATQLGVRHILIIFPVMFVLSGSVFKWLDDRKKSWIIYCLVAYQLISVFSYFPHFLPYTNEFIWDKKMAFKKLGDSNISYLEGRNFLQDYLNKHKEAIFAPDSIIPGKIVMDVNRILGLNYSFGEPKNK